MIGTGIAFLLIGALFGIAISAVSMRRTDEIDEQTVIRDTLEAVSKGVTVTVPVNTVIHVPTAFKTGQTWILLEHRESLKWFIIPQRKDK
jgi:hypothetical protein